LIHFYKSCRIEHKMPLETTVIGAWPKPSTLNLPDWFSEKGNFKEGESSRLTGMGGGYDPRSTINKRKEESDQLEEDIKAAAKLVMETQNELGIDVLTDGEIDRGAYYIHIMNNIKGIDMDNLAEKTMRSGAYSTYVPVVRSKVHIEEPSSWKEWKRSNELKPEGSILKFTVPGPMTLTDGIHNEFYATKQELQEDLVKAINKELLALAEYGCKVVQIDEPVLMRYPDEAWDYGIQNLAKCLDGLPEDITKVVHLCCGYPDKVDTDEYLKADKSNYGRLAEKLDNAGFDQISIEDAEAKIDLSILEKFKLSKIILGSITVARTKVETVQEIKDRVSQALEFIPKERLILAPDCGLGFLSEELIRAKLTNMVEAAKSF